MEERLAMIVSSVEELQDKLKIFITGEENIENFYRGSVKRNKDILAVFEADEDMAKTIDIWIAKGKYSKLLGLWVKGLVVDWNVYMMQLVRVGPFIYTPYGRWMGIEGDCRFRCGGGALIT